MKFLNGQLLVFSLFILIPAGTTLAAGLDEGSKKILQAYYSPETIEEIDLYLEGYEKISTDAEFEKTYHAGCDLLDTMYSRFYQAETAYMRSLEAENEYWDPISCCLEVLETLNGKMGPIEISCVAECTEIEFTFNKDALYEKAKTTTGTADDEMLELSLFIDGSYGRIADWGFKVWYEQTWDYGGSSLMGDGKFVEAIGMVQAYQKKYKGYSAEFEKYHAHFLQGMSREISYMNTKEKVMEEVNKAMGMGYFGKDDALKIRTHIQDINDPKTEIQFDCRNSPCSYG